MTKDEALAALYKEYQEDSERLIELGLPGCLAFGYVPGSAPGKIRAADKHHMALVKALLERIKDQRHVVH